MLPPVQFPQVFETARPRHCEGLERHRDAKWLGREHALQVFPMARHCPGAHIDQLLHLGQPDDEF